MSEPFYCKPNFEPRPSAYSLGSFCVFFFPGDLCTFHSCCGHGLSLGSKMGPLLPEDAVAEDGREVAGLGRLAHGGASHRGWFLSDNNHLKLIQKFNQLLEEHKVFTAKVPYALNRTIF